MSFEPNNEPDGVLGLWEVLAEAATPVSQNGWPCYETTSHFVQFTASGRKWWAASEDVAFLAQDWIVWFDANIQRIIQPGEVLDDWSYAFRPIRGQASGYSNHASATAWDLNSTLHPRGVHNTFTKAQYALMRARLARYVDEAGHQVLRLGAFYSSASVVDDMHVEINASNVSVKQARAKIVAAQQKGIDMELSDRVKYTTTAKARLKADDESVNNVLQWPPAVRVARDEMLAYHQAQTAQIAALAATVSALATALAKGSSLSAAQIQAAAKAGAEAALAELGQVLDHVDD
jgi:hypothetical protein